MQGESVHNVVGPSHLLEEFVENIADDALQPQDEYAAFTRTTDEELAERFSVAAECKLVCLSIFLLPVHG